MGVVLELPTDLYDKILRLLDAPDLAALACSCRHFSTLLAHDRFWAPRLARRYGRAFACSLLTAGAWRALPTRAAYAQQWVAAGNWLCGECHETTLAAGGDGSGRLHEFTAFHLQGNLLLTASAPVPRRGGGAIVGVWHLPSGRQLLALPGPATRYSVHALDLRAQLLVAAEERGGCSVWRLCDAFWDAVSGLEDGGSGAALPLDAGAAAEALLQVTDAEASFGVSFPWACQVSAVKVLGEGRGATGSADFPRHRPAPASAAAPPPAFALVLVCAMYERRLLAFDVHGKLLGSYNYPKGADFDASSRLLAVPVQPQDAASSEAAFTSCAVELTDVASGQQVARISPVAPKQRLSGPRSGRLHPRTSCTFVGDGRCLAVLRAAYVDESCGDALLYWVNLWDVAPLQPPGSSSTPNDRWPPVCMLASEFRGFCSHVPRLVLGITGDEPRSLWAWKWRFWFQDTMQLQPLAARPQAPTAGGDNVSRGTGEAGGGGGGSGRAPALAGSNFEHGAPGDAGPGAMGPLSAGEPGEEDGAVHSHHYRTTILDRSGTGTDAYCHCCHGPSEECNQYSNWFSKGARVVAVQSRRDGSGGARVHIQGIDGRLGVWHAPDNLLTVPRTTPLQPSQRAPSPGSTPALGSPSATQFHAPAARPSSLLYGANERWVALLEDGLLRVHDYCPNTTF